MEALSPPGKVDRGQWAAIARFEKRGDFHLGKIRWE